MVAVEGVAEKDIACALAKLITNVSVDIEDIIVKVRILSPALLIRAENSVDVTMFRNIEGVVVDFCVLCGAGYPEDSCSIVLADVIADDGSDTADVIV